MATKISQYASLDECAPIDRHLIIINGNSEGGKSLLCLDAIARGLHRPEPLWVKVVILSPTARLGTTWNGFSDVYTDPKTYSNIIQQILDHQEANISAACSVLIVMDDILGSVDREQQSKLTSLITKLATAGRHYKICLWLCTQSLKNRIIGNPDVRNNSRCIISCKTGSTSEEELIKMVGSREAVEGAFKEAYRFIVYDNTADSSRAAERISYVKIDPRKTPKLTLKYV